MKTIFFKNCLGVFQGGGCRGAAYIGAYERSIDLGISFSELVGASVGSIIATLIGAGSTPEQLKEIVMNMDFLSLLSSPKKEDFYNRLGFKMAMKYIPIKKLKYFTKLIQYLGLYSSDKIENWIDDKLKEILNITNRSVLFQDLIIPTTVVATNLEDLNLKIWGTEQTPDFRVSKAVRASCSMPIFFQPVEKKYIDGGLISNLPSFVFSERPVTHFNKVLAFSLVSDSPEKKVNDLKSYLALLSNAIVDGNQGIQESLQSNIYKIEIPTGNVKATDFNKMNDKIIDKLITNGRLAVDQFISNEHSLLYDKHSMSNTCKTSTDMNNFIVGSVADNINEVYIADYNTNWVYDLFPTLLSWVMNSAKIKLFLKANNDDYEHGDYRQRLLNAMGVDVTYVDDINSNLFVFNPESDNIGSAIVGLSNNKYIKAARYYSTKDSTVIKGLVNILGKEETFKGFNYSPKLSVVDKQELFDKMKLVPQYSDPCIDMSIKKIRIKDVHYMTRYVKGYKLRQIKILIDLYKSNNIDLFKTTKLSYIDNRYTLVGIPVIEEIGGKQFVIEGNTRLYYCYKNQIEEVSVLYIKNVTAPLPSNGMYSIQKILLTDSDHKGIDRYQSFNYKYFRPIEKSLRNPMDCLLEGE